MDRHVDTTWILAWVPHWSHVLRWAGGAAVVLLLMLGTWMGMQAQERFHLFLGTRCTTEDWPWMASQPTRALCVRRSSDQPWQVRRTSISTRLSHLRRRSCAPPASCDDTLQVEAKILPSEEVVLGVETTRDRGTMHQTVVTFVGENGKNYVVKDTSYSLSTGLHAVRCAYAIRSIVVNCGFEDVVAVPTVRNVLAVLRDNNGSHAKEIRFRNGHVSSFQPGMNLEALVHIGRETKDKRLRTVEILHEISAHSVLLAAAFDYLTLQYDRVAKNVLVDEQNHVHLIDNLDSSFGKYLGHEASEHKQIHASVFLEPSSTLFVGCFYDLQHRPPQYPSKLQTCLAEIQGNTTQQLYETYRLPDLESTQKLHRRAILLRGGLDVALAYYLGAQNLQGLRC